MSFCLVTEKKDSIRDYTERKADVVQFNSEIDVGFWKLRKPFISKIAMVDRRRTLGTNLSS